MAQPPFNPNENNSIINVSSSGYASGSNTSLYMFTSNTRMSVSVASNTAYPEFSLYALKISTATPVTRGYISSNNILTINTYARTAQTSIGNTVTGATVSEFLQLVYPTLVYAGPARGNVSTLDYSTLGPRPVVTYQTVEG